MISVSDERKSLTKKGEGCIISDSVKQMTLQRASDRGSCRMSKNFQVSELLDYYGALLTDKQRETVEFYYNDDLSLGEIAENTGISRQGVRDSIKRSEAVLFEAEEKLGLLQKSKELQERLDTIRKYIDVIDNLNIRRYRSNDINESIKIILAELEKLKEM